MGESVAPALIKVIASTHTDDVEARNAAYALMTIYREHPAEGIRMLRYAADTEKDFQAAERFRKEAEEAEAIFCRAPFKCDLQPN